MAIASINPATGETLREFKALTEAEIEEKLARGGASFPEAPEDIVRRAGRDSFQSG